MRRPRIWKRDVPLQGLIDWLASFFPVTATATNGDTIRHLEAEIERLESCLHAQEAVKPLYDEIKRLQELLRGVGANRYWEGRWRDEKAEIERLKNERWGLLSRIP